MTLPRRRRTKVRGKRSDSETRRRRKPARQADAGPRSERRQPAVGAAGPCLTGLRLTAEPAPVADPVARLAALESGAAGVETVALPHRRDLEARFGRPLDGVEVVTGPAVAGALDALEATAAERDGRVYLRTAVAPVEVVAHEVAHALQAPLSREGVKGGRERGRGRGDCAAVLSEDGAAERDARRVAATGGSPAARLPPGALALLRDDSVPIEEPAPEPSQDRTADAAPKTKDAGAGSDSASDTASGGDSADAAADAGTPDGGEPAIEPSNPAFAPPAIPETKLSPEEQAKRDAELAAAKDKVEQAKSGGDLVGAFADAPPTVKAVTQGGLEGRMGTIVSEDQGKFEKELPALEVTMGGEIDEGEVPQVEAPEVVDPRLEDGQPGAAQKPDLPPTAEPGKYQGNAAVKSVLDKIFSFFGFGRESVEKGFGKVKTSDGDIETSAGLQPKVPMAKGTETDPGRIEEQQSKGIEQGRDSGSEAQRKVLEGPGPERARLKELKEERRVGELKQPEAPKVAEAEGASSFRQLELEEEVKARFDLDQQEPMRQSTEEARLKTREAESERDTQRKAALDQAETERKALVETADGEQRTHVLEARKEIQKKRQGTIDEQGKAVRQLETDAETERKGSKGKIETKVREEEGKIESKYVEKEGEAEGHVRDGEEKAEKAKKAEEEKAEEKSWWDRAKSWVKEQFEKLAKVIGDIFDGIRKLVKKALDAARAFAKKLIDAAAKFVKEAIKAFGTVLKGLVNTLLKDTFPGLAKKLNDAIDKAVDVATKAVDKVAETLKKGVDLVVDALQKGIDAILDVFQAALNFAMSVLQAALTGDWGAVFKQLLEAALKLLGIDPKEFYAFAAKVQKTIGLIVDKPGQFLGNVLAAVKLGFSLFADNFLKHLKAGIIGWLTGSLGGNIQIPERFDLLGVLDLVRQLLGLTWDWLKKRATKVIGEKNVERLEALFSWVDTLRQEGWAGLLERIEGELAGLKEKILGEIGKFLSIQVIKAAVIWLASLFNPVGALVKVLMTVWNIYTFLRDQLQRIIEVVKTVVGALDKIARGVIDAAGQKIESVLGHLVPVAIDLLAKLLGLTGVTAGVRKILRSVNDSITKAVDKVLAKVAKTFKGKKGKKGTADAKDGKGAIEVGKPMIFQGGGEKHRLFIKVKGKDAQVMMRSEERTVAGWLGELSNEFAQRTEGWDTAKKEKARGAVETAQRLLTELDREADSLVKVKIEVAETAGAAKAPGAKGAASEQETLSDEERLNESLRTVLELLGGGAAADLVAKYEAEIAKMTPDYQKSFSKQLAAKNQSWAFLSWEEIKGQAGAEFPNVRSPLNKAKSPAHTFLPKKQQDLLARFNEFAREAWDETSQKRVRDGQPALGSYSGPTAREFMGKILGPNVTQQLNRDPSDPNQKMRDLIFRGATLDDLLGVIDPNIKGAAEVWVAEKTGGREIDLRVKKITGAKVLPFLEAMATGAPWNTGKNQIAANEFSDLFAAGTPEKRWLSAKFREVDSKNHEWIAAELTTRVINMARTAEGMEAGAVWVSYQNKLRTPTEALVFKPALHSREASLVPAEKTKGGFVSKLSAEELAGIPKSGAATVLQGHPGAVYAPVDDAGYRDKPVEQSVGHRRWHNEFRDALKKEIDRMKGLVSIRAIISNVDDAFTTTVWNPEAEPVSGTHFPHYFKGRSATSDEAGHAWLEERQKRAYRIEKERFKKPADEIVSQIRG